MVFHGLRTTDDCGLQTRLLAASNAIDRPIDRPAYPRCLMVPLCLGEAITVAILCLFLYLLLVALP